MRCVHHYGAASEPASSFSLTSRLILLSTAFSLAALPNDASAFVPPPRRADAVVTAAVFPVLDCSSNRFIQAKRNLGCRTKVLASSANDDADSSSNEPPKATSKGTEKKATGATAKAKSGGAKKSKRAKKQPAAKRQLEISSESLSPSQAESNQRDQLAGGGTDEDAKNYAEYTIPKTGYSLADQLENKSPENKERFETTLTHIIEGVFDKKELEFQYDQDGFPVGYSEVEGDVEGSHQGVARIDTISTMGNVGEEPVRWLVSLGDSADGDVQRESYALIDLPPYSDRLANDIRSFMDPEFNATASDGGSSKAKLDVILLTNQQCIHYDTSPAVYVTRKSDLKKWKKAFPSAQVVMYRLDIPRECREEVTQVLDGYGPWGWDEGAGTDDGESAGFKFVETGRPLTIEEWDDDTKAKVLTQGELPPDDQLGDNEDEVGDDKDADEHSLYSPEAIRKREEKYRLLAVYTPGHTFGSVTYILPQRGICCSGHTLPLENSGSASIEEDYDDDDDVSIGSIPIPKQGPRLDYQGYLATSASRPRQMSSALSLINNYIDRFRVVLPARGDVVFLDSHEATRKRELMESVGLYQKMSDIYGRLGIVE